MLISHLDPTGTQTGLALLGLSSRAGLLSPECQSGTTWKLSWKDCRHGRGSGCSSVCVSQDPWMWAPVYRAVSGPHLLVKT